MKPIRCSSLQLVAVRIGSNQFFALRIALRISDKSTRICILIVHYIPKHISYGPNLNFHFFQSWRPFSNMAAKFYNFDSSSGLVVSISEYKSKNTFL